MSVRSRKSELIRRKIYNANSFDGKIEGLFSADWIDRADGSVAVIGSAIGRGARHVLIRLCQHLGQGFTSHVKVQCQQLLIAFGTCTKDGLRNRKLRIAVDC